MNKGLNSKREYQRTGWASIPAPPVTPAITSTTLLHLASLELFIYSKWIILISPILENCSFVDQSPPAESLYRSHMCLGVLPHQADCQDLQLLQIFSLSSPHLSILDPPSVIWIIHSSICWLLLSSNLLSDWLQMLSGVTSAEILTHWVWLNQFCRITFTLKLVSFQSEVLILHMKEENRGERQGTVFSLSSVRFCAVAAGAEQGKPPHYHVRPLWCLPPVSCFGHFSACSPEHFALMKSCQSSGGDGWSGNKFLEAFWHSFAGAGRGEPSLAEQKAEMWLTPLNFDFWPHLNLDKMLIVLLEGDTTWTIS